MTLVHVTLTAQGCNRVVDEYGDWLYDIVQVEAWGESLSDAVQRARRELPLHYVETEVHAEVRDRAECCQCPDGRMYAADHLALSEGELWCYEHGVQYCGFDGADYPAYRAKCRTCKTVCDARKADECGGLCDACACAHEIMDRYDHEMEHGVGT